MNDHLKLPPYVSVFGTGPSLKPDCINWSTLPPFRIAVNAAAFARIPGLCAATAYDFEALDDFGALDKNVMIMHSAPGYRGHFQYELYHHPYPGWFTTANLIFGLARHGVKAINFVGFDSWSYSASDYDRLFKAGNFYSYDIMDLNIPWQKRQNDPNPYKIINRQIADALAHAGMIGVFRHLDPDLWLAGHRPDNTLDGSGPINVTTLSVSPHDAMLQAEELKDERE